MKLRRLKMQSEEITKIVRSFQRPWFVLLFPTAVIVIGVMVVRWLLPEAVKFIDRDIALVIIVSVLAVVNIIVSTTTAIVAFLFGERASKPKVEK